MHTHESNVQGDGKVPGAVPEAATGLPHSAYIAAVVEALEAARLHIRGRPRTWGCPDQDSHAYLYAEIRVDPRPVHDRGRADAPPGGEWPNGLDLIWRWLPEGPESGPLWQCSEPNDDGSLAREHREHDLPLLGCAAPDAVARAAIEVGARQADAGTGRCRPSGATGDIIGDAWDQADALTDACKAWFSR
ncbi:hypothetical protein [Streptomyces silvensis]|uniref:Uncharacterized protein n=1 Tax=Streptomyces silvensis TaxID=1765722 RepID=A0A0W7X9E3_9ACTN|nr:hypothetical protein [Streptomyces silvensis]KUF19386.1 hypothetical protein AT728_30760 [Streptomyces silvensis]